MQSLVFACPSVTSVCLSVFVYQRDHWLRTSSISTAGQELLYSARLYNNTNCIAYCSAPHSTTAIREVFIGRLHFLGRAKSELN